MLNRREFLKLSGVVAAAFAIAPQVLIEREYAFDPSWEYGAAIPVTDYNNEEMLKMVMEQLRGDIIKYLPPGTKYEIRAKIPTDFGRSKALSWYYHPRMASLPIMEPSTKIEKFDDFRGYAILGRFRA